MSCGAYTKSPCGITTAVRTCHVGSFAMCGLLHKCWRTRTTERGDSGRIDLGKTGRYKAGQGDQSEGARDCSPSHRHHHLRRGLKFARAVFAINELRRIHKVAMRHHDRCAHLPHGWIVCMCCLVCDREQSRSPSLCSPCPFLDLEPAKVRWALFLRTPSRAPHRTPPACAKRASSSDPPP